MARKELRPEDITVICDSREQTPLDVSPLRCVGGSLPTGDYSVVGLERYVTVERKSLDDLLGCIGRERERFEREMQRILAYPARLLIIEATWRDVIAGGWRSKVDPRAVGGSLIGWMVTGIPIFFAGDHASAGKIVSRFLFCAARRRWEEAQTLVQSLKIATKESEIAV